MCAPIDSITYNTLIIDLFLSYCLILRLIAYSVLNTI